MTTFTPGDKALLSMGPARKGIPVTVVEGPSSKGRYRVEAETRTQPAYFLWVASERLALVEEASVVVERQRNAAKMVADFGVRHELSSEERFALAEVLSALPEELTKPKQELPTEPGLYETSRGYIVTLDSLGVFRKDGHVLGNPQHVLPMHRLVRERPKVTREQVVRLINANRAGKLAAPSLADAILDLANGDTR